MFRKVLVANRGEIAARIIRTLRQMGIASVAAHSDADRFAPPTLAADEAVRIGPASAAESYLDIEALVDACRRTGAEAVHPGYGFLSERPEFAERLQEIGVRFIGPQPEHMRLFGLKHTAREIAAAAGVPLLPGSGLLGDADSAAAAASGVGYPVMLKSTAGGGGIGMQLCADETSLRARFDAVQWMAASSFGDGRVYLERFVAQARHVEVQIFGDGRGGVVALGERDCSLQRRHQKVIEETPAPVLPEATRRALHAAAIALGMSVAYESAGTVEFVYDAAADAFYFLEVNTRLQVEHCVTEAVFGIDLVAWMIAQAAGGFAIPSGLQPRGAAIEARIYAENPAENFRPSTGLLTEVSLPADARVDGWIETGVEVTPFYDPLLAKLVVHGVTREAAAAKLAAALASTRIGGIESNLDYLRAVCGSEMFRTGDMTTASLDGFCYTPRTIEVLAPGTQSSIQDWPGRLGYWHVGVPPSGPMDDRSFRRANRVVGNAEGAPALEMTFTGPTLRFHAPALIALSGAAMVAALDGEAVPYDVPVPVRGGQVLAVGAIEGAGARTYLAVRNGFDVPLFLGSGATFALGGFGGHTTGVLRTGDSLRIAAAGAVTAPAAAAADAGAISRSWILGVVYGPHGAPDYFTEEDIRDLFSAEYEVHFNSARTGVRLVGPKPRWARADGGDAGLHPSNIHDNAYAIGAIDFTGDMPVILGPDGPSLGGFVCPAVVARRERWKLGQLRPGDKVRFAPVDDAGPVVRQHGDICIRRAGDCALLVEFGPPLLDIALRLRVQLLLQAFEAARPTGIIDMTPGIRSLQLHFDPDILSQADLLAILETRISSLADPADAVVPSRIVHLPLSWDDETVQIAIRRYQELVRPDAPWCPSNIAFIRRINGLASEEEVRRVLFDASYLVLGLGDVYLGAPVATPLDPRHRLVTTKYNPARTWTPENAVGIGGAYLCVYGMEGPGGYQLVGRTIQMWNAWRSTEAFAPGQPWLLRYFDQIRFFPVSAAELAEARAAFPHGRYPVRIEETVFRWRDHQRRLEAHAAEITAFRQVQQAAFEAERQRWVAAGVDRFEDDLGQPEQAEDLPEGCLAVETPIPGSIWRIVVAPGEEVAAGAAVVIIESMKMEMRVVAPVGGRIESVLVQPGREVRAGQRVMVIRP